MFRNSFFRRYRQPAARPPACPTENVDQGANPFVTDIRSETLRNQNFRVVLWTGTHLQATLMEILPKDDIGLEIHPQTDQFLSVEEGQCLVQMGDEKDKLTFNHPAHAGCAIFIPAGKWHNIINTGFRPLKLYSIYAPPNHPHGTIQATKAIAEKMEEQHL